MTGPERSTANPFVALRATVVVAGMYLLAFIAWWASGERWPQQRWFGVHLFTLGIVTNLILALSSHFARTLTHQGGRPRSQALLVSNAGIVALLVGIPTDTRWLVALGAIALATEVTRSLLELRRLRRHALAGRFAWIVRSYEHAHGAFLLGTILGALLGMGLLAAKWSSWVRLAHLHLNVLGWAGLTLLATVVFFGPTTMRTRIRPGADERASRWLPPAAAALVVAATALILTGLDGAAGTAFRLVAAGALAVYALSVAQVCLPVIQAARTARATAARGGIVGACLWFIAVSAADVLLVATAGWRFLDAIGLAMLVGVLFQAIASSIAYFAPLLVDPSRTERRSARIERLDRTPGFRTFAWNAGAGLVVAAAPTGPVGGVVGSAAARAGWAIVIAGAVSLAVAVLVPTTPLGGTADAG